MPKLNELKSSNSVQSVDGEIADQATIKEREELDVLLTKISKLDPSSPERRRLLIVAAPIVRKLMN